MFILKVVVSLVLLSASHHYRRVTTTFSIPLETKYACEAAFDRLDDFGGALFWVARKQWNRPVLPGLIKASCDEVGTARI